MIIDLVSLKLILILTCVERYNYADRFIGSNDHTNWNNNLYIVRNDIVHRGMVYEISFEKCLRAIQAAKKAISFFEKYFF